VGRVPRSGPARTYVSANIFNVLNGGDYTEFARTGANRIYNSQNFLRYTNPQTPRALQLEAVVRF